MQQRLSLREWARNNKIWEPYSWRTFLEKDLVPFYRQAFILNEFYNFLKNYKICGKNSLKDIEDEILKNKVRVAIYGGAENPKTSFAKFMFDYFGIRAENASTFEESIKYYENLGDGIKISIHDKSWISSINIDTLIGKLISLISIISKKLNINLLTLGIQESHPYHPLEVIEPTSLLPQAGEKPEKLISLINEFRQHALNLSIGINPFVTFVQFSRAIPLLVLKEFLGCDIDKVIELANFLELKAYSMIDGTEISISTKSPEKIFIFYGTDSLSYKILELQSFLEKIDPVIKELHNNFVEEAIDQIHITFDEAWEDYKLIFNFLWDILIKKKINWCELVLEHGKIIRIESSYYKIQLSKKIWFRDFLIKIYPIISVGIVNPFYYSITKLHFDPVAEKWIDKVKKVIANEGKA
jgi:hypothetical protein